MDIINKYIATLVATLVFMTAVELIAPDNSLKKYLKFVMGLILISVLLTPVIKFFTGGEKMITDAIEKYEREFNTTEVSTENKNIEEGDDKSRKKAFVSNFTKNCEDLLIKKFSNIKCQCKLDCEVNFEDLSYSVNKLSVSIREGNVKSVEKVVIGEKENISKKDNELQGQIKSYLSNELGISSEKIEVNYY